MSVWALVGFDTSSRGEGRYRYRAYTTSAKRAALFNQIPKIQFTDSGHGIVFMSIPHSGPRKPTRLGCEEHVSRELARLNQKGAAA